MEKKPPPVIADWRKVMRPGPKVQVVLSRGKVVPRPPGVVSERASKERWDDDGGHFDKTAVPKPPIPGGD